MTALLEIMSVPEIAMILRTYIHTFSKINLSVCTYHCSSKQYYHAHIPTWVIATYVAIHVL